MLRIAVGGHSAGSGGALTVAGALCNFSETPVDLSDPRPVAFLAFSPQQPDSEGFFDTDFKNQPLMDADHGAGIDWHWRPRQQL